MLWINGGNIEAMQLCLPPNVSFLILVIAFTP